MMMGVVGMTMTKTTYDRRIVEGRTRETNLAMMKTRGGCGGCGGGVVAPWC